MTGRDTPEADQIVLVHLSDLNIGTSLLPGREPHSGPDRSDNHPHDWRLLRPLELALSDARQRVGLHRSEPMQVVISGDITRAGRDNDYATAMTLLHQRWQWRFGTTGRWLGFGWPRQHTHTVPGNQDHWRDGGYPRAIAPDWFEPTPWKHLIVSRAGTIRLELYGVDSSSGPTDADDQGTRDRFAGGAISDHELKHLHAELVRAAAEPVATRGQCVVRALVCHHAFATARPGPPAQPLRAPSRDALCGLALDFDIAAALTGHTRSFEALGWPLAGGGRTAVLWELRCGTTLQAEISPVGLQGFWVHQIVRGRGSPECEWTAWRYQAGGKSFEVDTQAPVRFPVPSI